MTLRWVDYAFGRGTEALALLRVACEDGDVLLIQGLGFDPRANLVLRQLRDLVPAGRLRVARVNPPGDAGDASLTEMYEENLNEFASLVEGLPNETVEVSVLDPTDHRAVGIALLRQIQDRNLVPTNGTVIIDISSLPSAVYFPLVGGMVAAKDAGDFHGDLLVVVADNPQIDASIEEEGTSDPGPIHGFSFDLGRETSETRTVVWAPVLGPRHAPQLDAIHLFVSPQEICPVIPFPASSLRKADELLLEYRVMLFERFEVEARNFIHADEGNPFDAYRALCRLNDRYKSHMAALGECVIVTSLHSSKVISIGVLLASLEKRIAVVTSARTAYLVRSVPGLRDSLSLTEMVCIWIAGQPYED